MSVSVVHRAITDDVPAERIADEGKSKCEAVSGEEVGHGD